MHMSDEAIPRHVTNDLANPSNHDGTSTGAAESGLFLVDYLSASPLLQGAKNYSQSISANYYRIQF